MGINGSGKVVAGASNSGLKGLLVKNMIGPAVAGSATLPQITTPGTLAGDAVDVMTHGEIVDLTGLTAGTSYWADGVTGALVAATATDAQPAGMGAGSRYAGFTVEATRLVVRMGTYAS